MKRFLLLCSLSASIISFQSFASAQVLQPISVSFSNADSATSFGTANMLIPDDLSATPTLANLASVTHAPVVDGNAWATNTTPIPGTTDSSPDYFPPLVSTPFFTFDLGSPQTLTGFVYWGFLRSNGDDAGNEAKSFELTFFNSVDDRLGDTLSFTADNPTGLSSREFSFPPISNVSAVRVNVTDNFFGDSAGVGNPGFNGNRVGISEIRFVNRSTTIQVTTLEDIDDGPNAFEDLDDISLREAINHSGSGSTIIFSEELTDGTIQLNGTQLLVDKNLVIDGSDLGIIIDGGGNGDFSQEAGESRCFLISDNDDNTSLTVSLLGLTIQNGSHDGNDAGANIHNRETLTLTQCQILNGRAFGGTEDANGGGIFNFNGSLSLNQCTVSGNQTQGSGADGGGIYVEGGSLSLNQCTVSGNQTHGEAANGGGIFSDTDLGDLGSLTTRLTHCTLFGNSVANTAGGGIYNFDGLTVIEHCTIVGNSAAISEGAGVSSFADAFTTTEIVNSIVRDNLGGPDLALDVGANPENSFIFSGDNLIGAFEEDISNAPAPNTEPLRLAPLGHYGGPTQTMHPLEGSPAILNTADVSRTDQRGFNLFGPPTIGAVKLGAISTVTTPGNSGDNSLRAALAAATTPGAIIRFGSGINGSMITLSSGQLEVPGTANGLFIDASDITGGVTISGNDQSRVFSIPAAATVAMHSLTIRDGKTASGAAGGGINSSGTLSLISCTVSHNQTGDGDFAGGGFGGFGGGINSSGTLSLISCTVSHNQTGDGGGGDEDSGGFGGFGGEGGGIRSSGTLSLISCTVSHNQTGDGGIGGIGGGGDGGDGGDGGGIRAIADVLTLTACTVSGNQTGQGGLDTSGGGINGEQGIDGGVSVFASTEVTIGQSIIAGNTGRTDDINVGNIDTDLGNNLLGGDPKLAPLGNYGGATFTMPPLPGSPVIDAAGGSNPGGTDQRGLPRFVGGMLDIGAVELQGTTLAAEPLLSFFFDSDGDGTPNGVEQAIGSNPLVSDPAHPNKLQPQGFDGTSFGLQFGYADGSIPLTLTRSIDLINFEEIAVSGDDFNTGLNPFFIRDSDPPEAKAFYRLEATRPE